MCAFMLQVCTCQSLFAYHRTSRSPFAPWVHLLTSLRSQSFSGSQGAYGDGKPSETLSATRVRYEKDRLRALIKEHMKTLNAWRTLWSLSQTSRRKAADARRARAAAVHGNGSNHHGRRVGSVSGSPLVLSDARMGTYPRHPLHLPELPLT